MSSFIISILSDSAYWKTKALTSHFWIIACEKKLLIESSKNLTIKSCTFRATLCNTFERTCSTFKNSCTLTNVWLNFPKIKMEKREKSLFSGHSMRNFQSSPKYFDTHSSSSSPTIVSKSLAGVVAGESAISTVGVKGTGLNYRGYNIEDLASKCLFEEVLYLLLYEKLPTLAELKCYKKKIASYRNLPTVLKGILEKIPSSAHPMDVLRTGCSVLGILFVETNPEMQQRDITTSLVARLPSLLLYWYYATNFGILIDTTSKTEDESLVEHFLRLLNPDKEAHPLILKALNVSLILYAEHDFNASTYVSRVTASTLTDIYSSIIAAIGALKGHLHGGANEATIHLLKSFKSEEDAEKKLIKMLKRGELIMGFGHRLYKLGDPRSPIIKEWSRYLSDSPIGNKKLFKISEKVEEIMKKEKNMYPNLDFYSASCYDQCGIPISFFTPLFVFARIAGWSAHIIEQRLNNKLIRPQSAYVGPPPLNFVSIEERNNTSKL